MNNLTKYPYFHPKNNYNHFPDDNGEAKQTVEGRYPITREATI